MLFTLLFDTPERIFTSQKSEMENPILENHTAGA